MRKTTLSCLLAAVSLLATSTFADWDPGQPYKYRQLPDLQNGMDVNATYNGQFPFVKVLADDWLCQSTDAVRDVHIWGSWLNDQLPRNSAGAPDPNAVVFKLSIHEDSRPPNTYSRPGQLVWQQVFQPGAFRARPYATSNELFYDPNTNQILGTDTTVWQYNFDQLLDPFIQQGTAANPKVYWLDVQAMPVGVPGGALPPVFGWKTSRDSYFPNPYGITDDDAVFGDTTGFGGTPLDWRDMHYPSQSPYAGQSINLAFVITPEPGSAFFVVAMASLVRRRR